MALADRPNAAQYRHDAQLLEALKGQPLSDEGVTIACRLIMRYDNTGPGSADLAASAQALLEQWGLDRRSGFYRARKLWASGFRPQLDLEALVGSGSDTTGA